MTNEELISKIKDAVSEAISEVSYEENERQFYGDIHFVVDDGWVSVDVTSINK